MLFPRGFLRPGPIVVLAGVALFALAHAASGCGESIHSEFVDPDAGTGPGTFDPCATGTSKCEGNAAIDCKSGARTDCAADKVCADGLGCVVCKPKAGSCANATGSVCRADGSGYDTFECDATQGMTCAPDGCKGACSPAELGPSYIGCEYWPTVTLNPVWSGFTFAILVASASDAAANVTITRGPNTITTLALAAHASQVVPLPWVTELKGGDVDACQEPPDPGATRVVAGGAYRLRSTSPVTVYQLSPLAYKIDPPPAACPAATGCGGSNTECLSYSNDASLLLPTNTLTRDYASLTWPSKTNRAAFLAITAVEDDTVVELSGVGAFAAGGGFDAAGAGKATLARGDVLEVIAEHGAGSGAGYGADPSGTRVKASKPVQLIAGHSCANVPAATTGYCDHLEEAMFPHETLAADYLVGFPSAEVGDSPYVLRVASVTPGTKVHFDPAVAPDAIVEPAAPLQVANLTGDVRVTADHPIAVAQYLPGSTSLPTPVGSGDPSMSLAVPTAQFRSQYVFVASLTYFTSYVNIIAPAGLTVTLDGADVPASEFVPIGGSGFSVARHKLGAGSDFHEAHASSPFGITVYGYGKDTSYMYPGGLDLKRLQPPPVR